MTGAHLYATAQTVADRDPRAVRIDANGQITLRPGVDFRDPRTVLPAPRRPQPRPPVRRPAPAMPRFLYVEAPGEC